MGFRIRYFLIFAVCLAVSLLRAQTPLLLEYLDHSAPRSTLDSPQPDTLSFDNGERRFLQPQTNYYIRVRFVVPDEWFELRSIYFFTINEIQNPAPCNLYVHKETDGNLGAVLGNAVLPGIVPNFAWNDVDLPSPVLLSPNSEFFVVLGPVPGGQQALGWHPILDNQDNFQDRSEIAFTGGHYGTYVPINLGRWLLRAGGLLDNNLPVEISSFEVTPQTDGIRVTLVTASETYIDHFELVRTIQGSTVAVTIASLPAQGSGATGYSYDFVDRGVVPGIVYSYYPVDFSSDGVRTPHPEFMRTGQIETAFVPGEFSLNAYPNPFNGSFSVRVEGITGPDFAVLLYNTNGQLVEQIHRGMVRDGLVRYSAHGNMAAGLYLLVARERGRMAAEKVLYLR